MMTSGAVCPWVWGHTYQMDVAVPKVINKLGVLKATDPPTPLPTPTPPPATQWTHRAQGCCFQGKNTSERKRESLFLGGEGLTTHCRKTFDNVLSHLSFICSKAVTA